MYTLRLLGSASLEGPDGLVAGRAALRQRVALLALLAIEHPRPISRDKVLACLWPESGTDEARHLLRDTLYILRTALGDDAVLSTGDDLRLNPDRLSSDLWEFAAAFARDDPEAAVGVYHGPFLSGFHFAGADEFERWAEAERSGLARRYGQALERLAERETHGGDPLKAVEWWRRLALEDPGNSRIALRYMQALAAVGDRAGALRHATVHTQLLRTELEALPDAEVAGFAEKLRLETGSAGSRSQEPRPISSVAVPLDGEWKDGVAPPRPAKPGQPTRRAWALPVALLALALAVGLAGAALSRHRAPHLNPQRVAVAVFANHTGRADLDDLGSMTADWIIRGLMETPLIDVTDVEAVYAGGPDDSTSSDPRELARRNGAGLVISGNYYRSGDSLIFQAGIVDVARGQVLRSFDPVSAPLEKPSEALKPLREGVASGLGAVMNPANQYFPVDPDLIPPPNYAAYREFIAGLRSGKLDDLDAEFRHYRQAIALDSSFIAPLVQLAYRATWNDQCPLTDSIANAWNRAGNT
jgi:DNA-binding SARP family transcriptional activator/TolB-like protein